MDKIKYVRLENEDGSYSEPIALSVDGKTIDIDGVDLVTMFDQKADNEEIEEMKEELSSKVDTSALLSLSKDITTQKTRIDNLATLTDGSTTGDAELIDGRIGATGVSYKNIGEAIRDQISDLSKIVDYELPLNLCLTTQIRDLETDKQVVKGNVIDGIHCTIDNSDNDDAIGVRLNWIDKPILLEGGNLYRLYDKQLDGKSPVGWDTHMLDLREVEGASKFIVREYSNYGTSFYVKEDIYAHLYLRIAENYSVEDLVIFPIIEKRKQNKENLLDPYLYVPRLQVEDLVIENQFDGSLTVKGHTTNANFNNSIINMPEGFYLEKGEHYLISSNNNAGIKPSSSTCRLVVRPNNSTTILAYENYEKGVLFSPTESGLYRIGLQIPAGYECDFKVTPCAVNIKDLKAITTQRDRIKVCAYNVGNFALGKAGNGKGTNELYGKFLETFKTVNADIYLFSEWDKYWNMDNNILSEDIFGRLKKYHSLFLDEHEGRYVAQMNYSNIPFVYEKYDYYADGESRHYTDNVCIINNKPVHFISTHFPWSTQELRHSDINKVFQYIQNNNIEYYVLGGDFNMGLDSNNPEVEHDQANMIREAKQDIELLESYGSVSAQGHIWGLLENDGLINTTNAATEEIPLKPYDNVVVSPNIDILNVYTIESEASDHLPLVVDLQVN